MNQFFVYIAVISLLDLAGLTTAKLYNLNHNPAYIWLTIMLFGVAGYFLMHAIRFEGMAIANVIWVAISIISSTVFGYFIFKEEISMMQFVGIAVILIGLVLMNVRIAQS